MRRGKTSRKSPSLGIFQDLTKRPYLSSFSAKIFDEAAGDFSGQSETGDWIYFSSVHISGGGPDRTMHRKGTTSNGRAKASEPSLQSWWDLPRPSLSPSIAQRHHDRHIVHLPIAH